VSVPARLPTVRRRVVSVPARLPTVRRSCVSVPACLPARLPAVWPHATPQQYQATAAPQLAMQQAPLQLASHSLSIGAVGGGAHGTLMHGGHTLYPNMSVAGQPGMMMMVQRPGMGAVQAAQPMPGAALIPHMAAAPGDAHMERGRGGQAQSERGQLEHGAISITVDAEQLAMVNSNMYNVQTMSGAQLNIMPLAQGMFQLVVSGSKAQVDHAKTLLSNVFTHGYGSTALQPTS